MASQPGRRRVARGEIERLPSGSLRVRVYAGLDPVTRKRRYLVATVPAGDTAERDAEAARTRLLQEVDRQRARPGAPAPALGAGPPGRKPAGAAPGRAHGRHRRPLGRSVSPDRVEGAQRPA